MTKKPFFISDKHSNFRHSTVLFAEMRFCHHEISIPGVTPKSYPVIFIHIKHNNFKFWLTMTDCMPAQSRLWDSFSFKWALMLYWTISFDSSGDSFTFKLGRRWKQRKTWQNQDPFWKAIPQSRFIVPIPGIPMSVSFTPLRNDRLSSSEKPVNFFPAQYYRVLFGYRVNPLRKSEHRLLFTGIMKFWKRFSDVRPAKGECFAYAAVSDGHPREWPATQKNGQLSRMVRSSAVVSIGNWARGLNADGSFPQSSSWGGRLFWRRW